MGRKLTLRDDLIPFVESFATMQGDDSVGSAMNRLIYLGLVAQGMISATPPKPTPNQQQPGDDLDLLTSIDL